MAAVAAVRMERSGGPMTNKYLAGREEGQPWLESVGTESTRAVKRGDTNIAVAVYWTIDP